MDTASLISALNDNKPPFLNALNSTVLDGNKEQNSASMSFDIPLDFCHSGNIVQGGFVAAMLDAVMVHALFIGAGQVFPTPSLELKVSYLAPSLAGRFRAEGYSVKLGKSIAFLEAKLFEENGELTATASSTVKLIRKTS